jgi:type I restriction enzyme S subunit
MRRGRPLKGDVLFTTEAPLGQVANVDREDIALAQRIVKFRGIAGVLNNDFLKYWLMGHASQATLSTLATGSTAEGIKASKLGQIPVAVPPVTEQLEVVAFLDDRRKALDAATRHVREHIERLREYRSSLISAGVTGQLELRGDEYREAA